MTTKVKWWEQKFKKYTTECLGLFTKLMMFDRLDVFRGYYMCGALQREFRDSGQGPHGPIYV